MTKPDELPRSVGFLLVPGFSMLALYSAIEAMRLANQLLGRRHYSWRFFTRDGRPGRSSCGMSIPADGVAGGIEGEMPGCVFVVAGFDPWPQADARLKNWLRALDRKGVILGAIDTGAFLLAAAGLLGAGRAVVHWESANAFSELFPDIAVSDRLYEIGGRRLLCAGGAAVLDMMVELIARTHGASLAAGIGQRLLIRRDAPAGETVADGTPDGSEVRRALHVMEQHVETTASIGEIAAATNVSKRTLERKFRQQLNQTPAQIYLLRRLDHARRLLRHTDMTIREIATACGFASTSYFCRAYKHCFQRTPGGDRRLDYSLVEGEVVLGDVVPPVHGGPAGRRVEH